MYTYHFEETLEDPMVREFSFPSFFVIDWNVVIDWKTFCFFFEFVCETEKLEKTEAHAFDRSEKLNQLNVRPCV